jgi:hypothetical protein
MKTSLVFAGVCAAMATAALASEVTLDSEVMMSQEFDSLLETLDSNEMVFVEVDSALEASVLDVPESSSAAAPAPAVSKLKALAKKVKSKAKAAARKSKALLKKAASGTVNVTKKAIKKAKAKVAAAKLKAVKAVKGIVKNNSLARAIRQTKKNLAPRAMPEGVFAHIADAPSVSAAPPSPKNKTKAVGAVKNFAKKVLVASGEKAQILKKLEKKVQEKRDDEEAKADALKPKSKYF